MRPQGRQGTTPVTCMGPTTRPAEQQPGGLAMVSAGSAAGNRGHTKVRVCADNNAPPDGAALLVQPVAAPAFAPTTQQTKKNSRSVGPWSGVTAKQHLQLAPAQPGFEVLEEQGSEQLPWPWKPDKRKLAARLWVYTEAHTVSCFDASEAAAKVSYERRLSRMTDVLNRSTTLLDWSQARGKPSGEHGKCHECEHKKSDEVYHGNCWDCWEVALCRPDPPNLPTRPMYDKANVYQRTKEFQFEELRMANMRKWELEQRLETQQDRWARMELERLERQEREESRREQQMEALKHEVQQLRQEMQEMRSLLARTRSGTRDHAVMTSRIVNLEQSILVAEHSILVSQNAQEDRGE
ncbi:hypothetical protein HPB49_003039 [Dermacentor silvarum]|uniref:Uncharacterized protein n=1 Tax=Dermacentor silvarum TaxID=543639 RepID=A0ACB8DT02_DERSI|nr:hypothetical protein HPB49_003039 [Dermacentor silvarum]